VKPIFVALSVSLLACASSTSSVLEGPGPDAGAQSDARAEEVAPTDTEVDAAVDILLDGSAQATFLYVVEGGGTVDLSGELIRDGLGFVSLVVTGQGDVFCSERGVAYAGRMDRPQAEAFVREHQLASLSRHTNDAQSGGGCPDAPSQRVRLGVAELRGSRCGADDTSFFARRVDQLGPLTRSCETGRSAVQGDVRYAAELAAPSEVEADADAFRDAPVWPASTPLTAADGSPGVLVTGSDAAALRALRLRKAQGEMGQAHHTFVPVAHADGTYWRVAVRDVLPVEGPEGGLH